MNDNERDASRFHGVAWKCMYVIYNRLDHVLDSQAFETEILNIDGIKEEMTHHDIDQIPCEFPHAKSLVFEVVNIWLVHATPSHPLPLLKWDRTTPPMEAFWMGTGTPRKMFHALPLWGCDQESFKRQHITDRAEDHCQYWKQHWSLECMLNDVRIGCNIRCICVHDIVIIIWWSYEEQINTL